MISKPVNPNYAAIVVTINNVIPLEGCDFVQGTSILGNHVIISKDIKIGDIGIYFPTECQLSHSYLTENNLYRKSELNKDTSKKGYFEENGRVKCVKFRGYKSEGLYMPLSSLEFITSQYSEFGILPGVEFDKLNGVEICKKYVIKYTSSESLPKNGNKKVKEQELKLVDRQFRFHEDTIALYKNLKLVKPEDYIHISYKIHGTSAISSKLLCKKKLSFWDKIGTFLGFNVVNVMYDYIYASRRVIKNPEINPNAQHFYNLDIWGIAHEYLKPYIPNGITLYYEIAGFLPGGAYIQDEFDYGCIRPITQEYVQGVNYKIFIYRITYTNSEGKVFEFSARQVQEWCIKNGLTPVPELFYGKAAEFSDERMTRENWEEKFLATIKEKYNDKDCYICNNKVPEEGCVIRLDKLELEAYKVKSFRFLEWETKKLNKNIIDIESEN